MASEFPRFQGDLSRAGELLTKAIALLEARNEKARLASAIEALADVFGKQNRYEEARALHEQSLALAHELKSPFRVAHALNGLTTLAFLERDFDRMEVLAREQLEISVGQKDDMYTGAAQHNLGEALRQRGILGPAAENYESARLIFEHLGDESAVAECIDGIGDVAAALGEFSVATCLWAHSRRVLSERGDRPWDAEGTEAGIAQARTALGSAAYEESRRWGSAMAGGEAVAMAAEIVALAQAGTTAAARDRPRGAE
jgi:tetratricopeptide (TPR) repeat protein